MKWWLMVAMAARLGAQTPASAAAPQTRADTGAASASPVPSTAEPWLTGSLDVGYRWRTDVGGSFDTYRSIVNLGSGPKLLGADFTILDPKRRYFDRIDVRAYSWGDDPYGTFHLHAVKKKLYDFNADYRDFAYFNFLPSFADPLLARGIILDQQSFDTRRRFTSFQLDLLPGNWLVPYFGYDRDAGSGTGIATFVTDANQFPVPNVLSDTTNQYHGGLRFEVRRLHGLIEQGGTTFKDNESLYQASGPNYGDVNKPILGQTLFLNSVLAAYGIRADSIYSKAILAYNPLSWLDLYGQFLYSRPDSSVNYQQAAAGNLLQQNPLLFYNGQLFILGAEAQMPHTTGTAGGEIRLPHKIRVTQSWLTDRLDNAGSAISHNNVFGASGSQQNLALLTSQLASSYNKVQTDVFWEVYSHLTLRAGYRYEWGDASQRILPPAGLASADDVDLRRNVVLGGFTFQPWQKLTITGEAEGAPDDQEYFRTSLHNYQKARAQVRYRAAPGITVSGDFNLLNNQNPAPDVRGDYLARQASISFLWSPSGKRFDMLGAYTRTTLRSDILILQPQNLVPAQSIYRENAHTATLLANLNLPHVRSFAPKITAGGSLFISSGSRPTRYYQPNATMWLPFWKNLKGFAEWRYYGFGEPFYTYEDFHAHTITLGVRVMR